MVVGKFNRHSCSWIDWGHNMWREAGHGLEGVAMRGSKREQAQIAARRTDGGKNRGRQDRLGWN